MNMADETGEWLTLSWAGEIDEELSSADVQEADNRRQEKCSSRSISKKSVSEVIVPKNRSTERCHDKNVDTEKRKQNMADETGEWLTLSWAGEIDEEFSSADVQKADKGRQENCSSRSINKKSVSDVIVPKNRSTERYHDQNADTEKRKQNMADETEWLTLSCASEIDEEYSSADLEEADNGRQEEKCSRSISNVSDSEVIVPKKRYIEWHGQDADTKKRKQQVELETDAAVLQRRQKQIDYGKNTVGYDNYRAQVDISTRANYEPRTPDKYAKYSRRSWDAKIKNWRKRLHLYDNVQDKNSSSNDEND